MKRFLVTYTLCLLSLSTAFAQWGNRAKEEEEEKHEFERRLKQERLLEQGRDVVEAFDEVVLRWEEVAEELGTYAGLSEFCTNSEYKDHVNVILHDIHHFDTLLYSVLTAKVELESINHELKVTLHEIEKVEEKFKPKNFYSKLKDDCTARKYIERHKEELQNDVGMKSFDGEALILDNDIHHYIHQVTHLVELIDKHGHHLLD